jgi:alkanesulfonate monooxygenase SsuD/methylene tetrahydromethanopterin reductase-like flavin-dependent oxidoreductase (luciferase family)
VSSAPVSVSFHLREEHIAGCGGRLGEVLKAIEAAGLDAAGVGDHVSFRGGTGTDGLVSAAAVLAASERLIVRTAVYLLPLRHPVLVARQLVSISQLAPGRLVFGVGVGGEDVHEFAVCEVDHRLRGARTDEALPLLRELLTGRPVTHLGRFFRFEEAQVAPGVSGLPIIVGGRSKAALRRAGRFGDGWMALWVSPRRFAEGAALVAEAAAEAGRTGVGWRHEHQGWCFFDDDTDAASERARRLIERLYDLPFERFQRYTPCGPAEVVAEALRPFVQLGIRQFNLVADAPRLDHAIEQAGLVQRMLNAPPPSSPRSRGEDR